jgi:hypothetical protein
MQWNNRNFVIILPNCFLIELTIKKFYIEKIQNVMFIIPESIYIMLYIALYKVAIPKT